MWEAWIFWQMRLAGTNILYVGDITVTTIILPGGKNDSLSKSPKHLIGQDLVTDLS